MLGTAQGSHPRRLNKRKNSVILSEAAKYVAPALGATDN
jgi:hypothetical protein